MKITCRHNRDWYDGPRFEYAVGRNAIDVNVTASSWPIRGVELAKAVCGVLNEFKKSPGERILDFGAGSWLRYVQCVRKTLPDRELYAVEYDEAFRDDALPIKKSLDPNVTFWTPRRFANARKPKFDIIIAVNVLNTIPEEKHQRDVFAHLCNRLNPLGWLLVYQRIWVEKENPEGALPYGDGWVVPQVHYNQHTYRAKTGANWFNARAADNGLKIVATKTEITSSNTFFRVWEKLF